MANICVRETVYLPAEVKAEPVVPEIELSLPPQSWFRPEWYPARVEREARERAVEEQNSDIKKWLRFIALLLEGIVFCGGSLWLYLLMLAWVGSP